MMKKLIVMALCLCFLAGVLAGCAKNGKNTESRFEADNEIYTYIKPDPEKTQLVVGVAGNIDVTKLADAFMSANADVQIIMLNITGGNDYSSPVKEWITNGDVPDILFGQGTFMNEVAGYFEDLSAYPFIKNFTAESLHDNTYDGKVKYLPGASKIEGLCYNVTLFKQYGWETPKTTDEFIELCKKIEADTSGEIDSWNPNAKYPVNLVGALQAFCYSDILSGAENRIWLNDFMNGKASFAGHMEPMYELLQCLADEGLLTEDYFSYSATTRFKEFTEGKIAMCNYCCGGIINLGEENNFEFGFIPFPSSVAGEGNLMTTYSFLCGIPTAERTDKVKDASSRFLAFISSNEAQDIILSKGLLISNLRGYEAALDLDDYDYFEEGAAAFRDGRVMTTKDFRLKGVGVEFFPLQVIRDQALCMVKGELTAAQAIAEIDAAAKGYFDGTITDQKPEVIATVPSEMTILETSLYMADMFRDKTGADVALMPNNIAYRGNVMKIYAGDFTTYKLDVIKPRSYDNKAMLTKVSVTGEQLLEMLNTIPGYAEDSDGIYAFSGLKATVAPWNPIGERYISVTLADGTAIDNSREYTVAFWAGSIPVQYVTETAETYEGTFEELLSAYMKADGEVTAPNDGRITLVWNLTQ